MILALLLLQIFLVTANPFHKYPYVFLLDIGNEELEKVNTEQIRLSSPGGSVALRHPAVGDGDDIAHVRVSSIDFGTDLKVTVVDGGPGYKYVVIVLMGNPDVAYEAVITIQTVPDAVNDGSLQTIEDNSSNVEGDIPKTYQVSEDDVNNSAEDFNDNDESEPSQIALDKKEEFAQESANVYSYAQNEVSSDYDSEQNNREITNIRDSDDNTDVNEQIGNDYEEDEPRINQASAYTADEDYSQDNQPIIVDQSLYDKYKALKDHLYDGSEVYSQEYQEPDKNDDDRPVALDVYDDYEENESYRDSNNNFVDIDEVSAVEQ